MAPPKPSPSPATTKTRIITHMNTDHANTLSLFAQHYNRLPPSAARSAHLADISPTHLTLTTSSPWPRLLIPLDPPLSASLTDARTRFVAMHNECLAALDLSDVEVKAYRLPNKRWQWAFALGVVAVYTTFPFRGALDPAGQGWAYSLWSGFGRVPWLGDLAYFAAPIVLPLTVMIHVVEAVYFARGRLRRHQVPRGGKVWWCWIGDVMLEGFGAFLRFDEVVADEVERKGKGKVEGLKRAAENGKAEH
jgi:hypothetical protein